MTVLLFSWKGFPDHSRNHTHGSVLRFEFDFVDFPPCFFFGVCLNFEV
jgi:hypothetical protein